MVEDLKQLRVDLLSTFNSYKNQFLHFVNVNLQFTSYVYAGDLLMENSLEAWVINLTKEPCSAEPGPEALLDVANLDAGDLLVVL